MQGAILQGEGCQGGQAAVPCNMRQLLPGLQRAQRPKLPARSAACNKCSSSHKHDTVQQLAPSKQTLQPLHPGVKRCPVRLCEGHTLSRSPNRRDFKEAEPVDRARRKQQALLTRLLAGAQRQLADWHAGACRPHAPHALQQQQRGTPSLHSPCMLTRKACSMQCACSPSA